jgi:hypothetical protein
MSRRRETEARRIVYWMIQRFKSTCRSFSRRIAGMTIMHEPYEGWKPSTGVWQGL